MTVSITTAIVLALALQAQPAANETTEATTTEQAASAERALPNAEPAPAPAPPPAPPAEPEEITDRNHPDYVRCRREPVIGSLAKFTRRCFTNREWEEIARVGNSGSRSIVDSARSGMWDAPTN